MKKIFCMSLCMVLCVVCMAQVEPDFVGESIIINGGQSIKLEKQRAVVETKASAGMYIVGMGKVKSKIALPGAASPVRVNGGSLELVVRAVDNESDPMSIISLFRFKSSKKERKAELQSVGTFSGAKSNNLDYVDFVGEKYGEKSYKLIVSNITAGEYGIMVTNPNNRDEKNVIVACFGVD